jgi:hypothetical protein
MSYRIQTFDTASAAFVNTAHESADIRALKRLVEGDAFRGVQVRIVNESGQIIFEPPIHGEKPDFTLNDLAKMMNVPIVDSPDKLFGGPGDKKK